MALAAAAGVAVENARLYENVQRRQRTLEIRTHLATELLRGMPREATLELVASSALELLGADLATVVLSDPARSDLYVASAAGSAAGEVSGARLSAEHSLSAAVLSSGTPELVADARGDSRVDPAMHASEGVHCWCCR